MDSVIMCKSSQKSGQGPKPKRDIIIGPKITKKITDRSICRDQNEAYL